MVTADTPLVRASALVGRAVVTEGGSSSYEVQDLILDEDGTRIDGFTLREPGILGKRHAAAMPMASVKKIGPDAVIIADDHQLEVDGHDPAVCADVKGTKVLSDGGVELGTIGDVVVQTKRGKVEVVVLELDRSEDPFVVLPSGTSVRGDAVIVPSGTEDRLHATPEAAAEALQDR